MPLSLAEAKAIFDDVFRCVGADLDGSFPAPIVEVVLACGDPATAERWTRARRIPLERARLYAAMADASPTDAPRLLTLADEAAACAHHPLPAIDLVRRYGITL